MTKDDQMVLAMFFEAEFANDATSVAEWVDNEAGYDSEEERDEFIERVRNFVRTGS